MLSDRPRRHFFSARQSIIGSCPALSNLIEVPAGLRLTFPARVLHWLMLALRLLAAFLLIAGCFHRSDVRRLVEPGGPPVDVGHYAEHLVMLGAEHPLARKAERLRLDIEANEAVTRRVVRDHLELKSPLEFRFMYVGHDSVNQRLIMRYFAHHPDPTTIAGWQVQFVYALPALHLVRALVEEVPLE